MFVLDNYKQKYLYKPIINTKAYTVELIGNTSNYTEVNHDG